jgi:hypothetical protein
MEEYEVDEIESVNECDVLIEEAEEEKSVLDTRIVNLIQRQKTVSGTSIDVKAEFDSNKTQLDAVNLALSTMPAGKARDINEKTQKRLEYRQFLLGNRKKSYSVVAKLEIKHELNLCNLQLGEKVAFLTALKSRRTVLAGA